MLLPLSAKANLIQRAMLCTVCCKRWYISKQKWSRFTAGKGACSHSQTRVSNEQLSLGCWVRAGAVALMRVIDTLRLRNINANYIPRMTMRDGKITTANQMPQMHYREKSGDCAVKSGIDTVSISTKVIQSLSSVLTRQYKLAVYEPLCHCVRNMAITVGVFFHAVFLLLFVVGSHATGPKVTDIKLPLIGTDTATVTWAAPEQPHGDIKSYHITITNRDTKEQQEFEITSNEITFHNLTPHTWYDIRVRTENRQLNGNGGGLGEPVLIVLLTAPLAGQKVRDINFPVIGKYSINVQWMAPEMPYGEITSYRVETTDAKENMIADTDVYGTEATISNLSPSTTYSISVRTINKPSYFGMYYGGAGEAVTKVVTTLPLGSLQVTDIKIEHIGSDNAMVKWTAPKQQHGDIMSYHVTVTNRDTKEQQEMETTSNGITISNLTPHTWYDIKVRTEYRHLTSNVGGLGEPAQIALSTEPLAGQIVQNIRFSDIASFSLNVQWKAPEMPYGEINSYRVGTMDAKGNMIAETEVYEAKATISNLTPFTTYSISIQTINKPGSFGMYYGGAGDVVTILVTTLPLAGQPVTDMKISHIGPNSATVTWKAPDPPHGDIMSFRVTVTNRDTKKQKKTETTSNGITISHLTPHTSYEIAVRTENRQLNSKGGGLGEPVEIELSTEPLDNQEFDWRAWHGS